MKKTFVKVLLFISSTALVGCDFSYISHVGYNQAVLLGRRVPIETALKEYPLTEDEKKKLQMISELKAFARENLKLDINEKVYSSYVQLERPYVTYLLRVSSAYELKAYQWNFPVAGSFPYKGFFSKEKAKKAARAFPPEEYDTLVRGVSAYSTLNWFDDPVLSSMLSYSETDFVATIFHELAHTVLFFKNHVNFNERFAEFTGRKATELFYISREGEDSETAQELRQRWKDELLFSAFMVKEYEDLSKWYKEGKGHITPEMKTKRLRDIQDRFLSQIRPQINSNRYDYFHKIKLNNAILLSYRSYNFKMDEFERLYDLSGKDIPSFIENCAQFEFAEDPEVALKLAVNKMSFQAVKEKLNKPENMEEWEGKEDESNSRLKAPSP